MMINQNNTFSFVILCVTLTIHSYQTQSLEQAIEHGIRLFKTNITKAQEHFCMLARTYPDCAQVHFNRGLIALEYYDATSAIEAFQTAIIHKPDYTKAHYHLAQLLEQKNLLPNPLNALDSYISPDLIKRSVIINQVHNTSTNNVMTEVSLGELVDKITILQIKQKKITDPAKLKNIEKELHVLQQTRGNHIKPNAIIEDITQKLYDVNNKLWDIEDALREKERTQTFDEEFIQLARSVYYTNDERFAHKKAINDLLGSSIKEEKSYAEYQLK